MDQAPPLVRPTERPMTQLCALGTHVIQQIPTGRYVCVYDCGLQFTEYHALVVGGGAVAATPLPRETS